MPAGARPAAASAPRAEPAARACGVGRGSGRGPAAARSGSARPVGSRGIAKPPPRSISRGASRRPSRRPPRPRGGRSPPRRPPRSAGRRSGARRAPSRRAARSRRAGRELRERGVDLGVDHARAVVLDREMGRLAGAKSEPALGGREPRAEPEPDARGVAELRARARACARSSSSESSVMRTPARSARASVSRALVAPLSEIRSGGTPARSASSSSPSPNTSQPSPSASRIRRRASTVFGLQRRQHERLAVRPGLRGRVAPGARVARRRASETTNSGVPKRRRAPPRRAPPRRGVRRARRGSRRARTSRARSLRSRRTAAAADHGRARVAHRAQQEVEAGRGVPRGPISPESHVVGTIGACQL